MSLTLTNNGGGDFQPHPEGIIPAVCVDVMDQGLMETSFQGVKKLQPKIKIVFESEAVTDKGVRCTVARSVTASLNPKATLAIMLGKWRGRPIGDNESVDLQKLIGASCTLVISHSKSPDGQKTYANIDAISKPTKKVVPSGQYDPAAARKRFAEWKAKQGLPTAPGGAPAPADDGDGTDLGPAAAEPRPGYKPTPAAPAPQPAAPDESCDVPF